MKTFILIILVTIGTTCIAGSAFLPQSPPASPLQKPVPGHGGIAGYVFDPDGKPVANAEVYAKILDDRPIVGRYPTSNTDKDGRFLIQNVRPGLNRIYASKEEDGYPDTSGGMYQDTERQAPPEVFVREGQVIHGVVVHLGKKCEKLFGSVVDADTHRPVKYAKITFYRANDPNMYSNSFGSSEEGKFELLLPPVPIKIRASAQDYEQSRDLSVHELLKSARSLATPKKENEITISLRRAK